MEKIKLKKLVLTAVFAAVAVVGSLFSFPVFGSKCAPVQHLINVLCAVILGPGYGVAAAFVSSLIRNLLGLGTLLAFPGSMCGALLAGILYNLKYIRQDKLIEVSSKDLVAEYVGQTAPKTMEVINRARGGILFIDEAYSLAVSNNNSYNAEAIATLIKAMEDYRDDLVVIFAGYTKEMQDFINSNSGIASRIGYTFTFEDYTNEELKQIFINMIKKSGFNIEDEALLKLDALINENRNTKNFGNARFIRNVYEKTIVLHASNTKKIKNMDKLKLITKEDINY